MMSAIRVSLLEPVPADLLGHFQSLMAHCDVGISEYDVSSAPNGFITIAYEGPLSIESVSSKVHALAKRVVEYGLSAQSTLYCAIDSRTPDWDPQLDTRLNTSRLTVPITFGGWALTGIAARLFRMFDEDFRRLTQQTGAIEMVIPSMIEIEFLRRISLFDALPHYLTFNHHLVNDVDQIDDFVRRIRTNPDDAAPPLAQSKTVLSPAVCYQIYYLLQNSLVPPEGLRVTTLGKCFRWEGANVSHLRRLWEYTVREFVVLGTADQVLSTRLRMMDLTAEYCHSLGLKGEIRTANDPFFSADGGSKGAYQRGFELKYELRLQCDAAGNSIAASSFNHMQRAFTGPCCISSDRSLDKESASLIHSGCVGWGIERWVYAFFAQWGLDPKAWPRDIATRCLD